MEGFESDARKGVYPRWLTLLAGRGREEYLLSLKNPFLVSLVVFTASITLGYLFSNQITEKQLIDLLGEIPNIGELGPMFFMLFIFANNALKSFLWMSLGLLFGIAPLLFTTLNGFLLGLVAHRFSQTVGPLLVLIAIAPHGVVELPTILLSAAIGVKFGYGLINKIRGGGRLTSELKMGLSLFISRVVPFLLLAAAIEAFFTPVLVYLIIGRP